METTEQVQAIDKFTSQLSATIWGHRFTDGQRGPEYVLEFLNVLFGAQYRFDSTEYTRRMAVGLRKFIFEGVKQGSVREILELSEDERERIYNTIQNEDDISILRKFLRNLEVTLYNANGKEADRSWFARTLYPLHESLLFFELRKKGNALSVERNFFARGGELYFLMLAFGTENNKSRRKFIENRFQQLLQKNKPIEKVVNHISCAFVDDEAESEGRKGKLRSINADENIPRLPDENKSIYTNFAEELEQLLKIDLDIYEMFQLLTSLVCFQLTRYMHDCAQINHQEKVIYFFDCLNGQNNHITQLSSRNFEQHENLIKSKFEEAFERKYIEAIGKPEEIDRSLIQWKEQPDEFLKRLGLSQMKKRKEAIVATLNKCTTLQDVQEKLYGVVKDAVSDQLKKHQLNITRILTRDGGMATFRYGSTANYRYTISDSFLQVLVFTVVDPRQKMEYNLFLDQLFTRYGIVIGEAQAKKCAIYEKSKLNVRYFQDNEKALRQKLRQNGLLVEFSDATAMIQNPYAISTHVEELIHV